MKLFISLFLILAAASIICGQKIFAVQDFSKDYYAKVSLDSPAEVFSPGSVAIYQKRTNKLLIKVESEELTTDFEEGKAKVNVKELPYGEQSVVIYDDFNFDGIKDFAVIDGQNSCYHGPSFQIYLAGKVKGRFVLSKSFTQLAQEYCGMFEVNQAEKKLATMTKSGCCWHQFSEYVVENNQPKAVKIVEDDAMGFPFSEISTQIRSGQRMIKTSVRAVDLKDENVKILLSFKTKNNDEVVLFSYENALNYALIDRKENVEFAYPKDSNEEDQNFTLDSKETPTALFFTNKGVTYKIYETEKQKIGVEVDVKGKVSDISGNLDSQKGSLRKLIDGNLNNISFKK